MLIVDFFDQGLAQVVERFPPHTLPVLRTVKNWVFSGAQIGSNVSCADWFHYKPGTAKSAGIPESVQGSIRWNGSSCPNARTGASSPTKRGDESHPIIHEFTHAWDSLVYNPGDQIVNGQCPVTNWMPPVGGAGSRGPVLFSDSMLGMVNCRNESPVTDAYFNARATGLYKHCYASYNHSEYFASLSEAWFATSPCNPQGESSADRHPAGGWTRAELLEYDPVGAAAVEAAWNTIP